MVHSKKATDPNAPGRPSSSFILYMRNCIRQSKELASQSFLERNRLIRVGWAALDTDQKQIYNEQAAREREKYKADVAAYQTTQAYRDWQAKQEGSKTSPVKDGRKGAGKGKRGADQRLLAEETSAPKTCRIPIFSQEFLEYNRQREMSLRNLRKQAAQLDEETALLSKHVENLINVSADLEQHIKTTEAELAIEEAVTLKLRKELAATFSELTVPTNGDAARSPSGTMGSERITMSSVDSYLKNLSTLIQSGQHGDLQTKAIELLKNAVKTKTLTLCTI